MTASGPILSRPFLLLWLVGFGYYAGVYLLIPVLPLYLHRLGFGPAAIGLLLAVMSLFALAVRPFGGWLADNAGKLPFIRLGLVLLAGSTIALPMAGSALSFGLLRAVNGAGWGLTTSNANTLSGELAPPSRRGEAVGLYTIAGSAAMAFGPIVGVDLYRRAGFEGAAVVATLCSGVAVLAAFILRVPARTHTTWPFSIRGLVVPECLQPASVVIVHAAMYGVLISFLPLLLEQEGIGSSGIFFMIYALSLIPARAAAGRASDRLGRSLVIAPGLVTGGASLALLAVARQPWQPAVAAVLFALAMALVQPASLAWAMDLGASRGATAMANMVMAQDLGIAVGGIVPGLVGAAAGYRVLFASAALGAPLALLLLLLATRAQRARGAPS